MEFSHITLIVLQESPIVWEGNVGSIKPKKTVAVRCESNPINGFFMKMWKNQQIGVDYLEEGALSWVYHMSSKNNRQISKTWKLDYEAKISEGNTHDPA